VTNQKQRLETLELRRPGFAETPVQTMLLDLLITLHRWNLRIPRTACCEYHAAVRSLSEVQQCLLEAGCKSMDEGSEIGERQCVQCPECFALNVNAEDLNNFRCELCGCDATALQEQGSYMSLASQGHVIRSASI